MGYMAIEHMLNKRRKVSKSREKYGVLQILRSTFVVSVC